MSSDIGVLEAARAIRLLSFLASEPDIKLLFTDIGLPGPFNGRQLADEALRSAAAISRCCSPVATPKMRSFTTDGSIPVSI